MNRRAEKLLLSDARNAGIFAHLSARFESTFGRKPTEVERNALVLATVKTLKPKETITVSRAMRRRSQALALRELRHVRVPQGPPPAEEATDG